MDPPRPPAYDPERGRMFIERERVVAQPNGLALPAPTAVDPAAQARRALELLQANNSRDLIGMFRGMPKAEQQAIVAAFEAMPNTRRMFFAGDRRTFESIARRRMSAADGVFLSAILRNPSSVPTNADRAEAALVQQSPEQLLALYRELTPAQIAEMESDYPGRYGGSLQERAIGREVGGRRRGGVLSGDQVAIYTQLRTGTSTPTAAARPAETLLRERVEVLSRLLSPRAMLDMPLLEQTMRGIPQDERPAVSEAFRAANRGRTIEASLEGLMRRGAESVGMPLNGGPMPLWAQTRFQHLRDSWSGTRAPEAVLLDAATGRLPDTMAAEAVRGMSPADLAQLRPRFEAAYRERFPTADASGAFERVVSGFDSSVQREIQLHAAIGDVYRTRDFALAEERVRGIWNEERSLTRGGWAEFRNRFMNATGVTGPELDETARRFFDAAHDLRRRVDGGHQPNADDVGAMMQNYRAFGQRLEAYYVERGETAQNAAALAALVGGLGFGAVLGTAGLTTRGIIASALVGASAQTTVQRALDPQATTTQLALAFATGATLEVGGGLALRAGIRALQARRAARGTEGQGEAALDRPGTHDTVQSGRYADMLPARDTPNASPRYIGRTTFEGREVEVRAFDSGRIQIGDRVFEGRLHRDTQQLYFRGPDGEQWGARLSGPNNQFSVTRTTRSHNSAVIDNEPVVLEGSTVRTGDGRVVGFTATLRGGRIATRIDPSDPFAREIGDLMSAPGRQLERSQSGDLDLMLTPRVNGYHYAIDPAGRAYRLEHAGDNVVITTGDGQSRIVRLVNGEARVTAPPPGLHQLGPDAVMMDGKLQRLVPTETDGMFIGRAANDRGLGLYHRASDGTVSPASVTGPARMLAARGGDDVFVVAPGPNGRATVHAAIVPNADRGFIVRAQDGVVRYARRLRAGEYAIEDAARLDPHLVVLGGSAYRRELAGVLEDGRQVWAARRVEGDGPAWRLIDTPDATTTPRIVTPAEGRPTVLRHKGTGEPSVVIDRGIVYRAEYAPEDARALARRVLGRIVEPEDAWPVAQRQTLQRLRATFRGDDGALQSALLGTDPQAVRRLESALGPGARDDLWRTFGVVSEARDPLHYATRVGSLADRNPAPVHVPHSGAPIGLIDHPDDIGIFVARGRGLQRATDDEIRAQYNRMVPELSAPIRNSEWNELARPSRVTIEPRGRGTERIITIERPGVPPQRVRVTIPSRLEPGVPTLDELAELLRQIPNVALRSLDNVVYGGDRVASFMHGTHTMRIGNTANWRHMSREQLRVITHELAGHGIELGDPLVHRALLLARRLDGIGSTHPYGNLNRMESFATGIEDTATNAVDAARRSPHTSRLFWHLLRDPQVTTSPETRRALLGGTSLALMFGIIPRLSTRDDEGL